MAEPHSATDQFTSSTTHIVYSVMRFLRVVRHRKEIVLASLLVAAILGAIYYATAPREYKVTTKLWVMKNESDQIDAITQDSHRQGILPTYVQLFSESRVLEPALDALGQEPATARVDLAPFPRDQWLKEIRKRLQARAIRATDIIELSYLSGDPHAAVTVVDKIVNSYVDFINKNRESILSSIEHLLKGELASVTAQLKDKEEELKRAIAEVRDLSTGDGMAVHPAIHQANKIHEEFVDVQRKRFKLQSSLTSLETTLRQSGDLQPHLLDIEPLIGRELVLQALGLSAKDAEVLARQELSVAEERANLEARLPYYGPNHPEIQRLRRNIASRQKEVAEYSLRRSTETQAIYNQQLGETLLSMVRENLSKAWDLEQMLYSQFKQAEDEAVRVKIKLTEIQDMRLEKQRLDDQSEALLDSLKKMETNPTDVRVTVVTKPVADLRPVSPKLLWMLFVCVSGGALAGSAIVYVLDVLDDRFRSPEELREQLGAPVLAMIRRLPDTQQSGVDALQMHAAADSIESEAFRTLRTTVAFSGEKMDCLAVSSSEPGDGKTTVLANFGVACSQAGKRTLLIDADMRRPGLSRLFELRGSKGLGEIIRGEDLDAGQQAAALVQPTGADNLDILPCGVRPSDPTGMLAGPRFADLLAWAESTYDQVLIDTPPILAASDATVIGRAVDGFILVVQPEKNHRRLVHRAAEEILAANLNFVGIVANRVGQGRGHSYYGSGYGYGYGYGYGSGYGDEEARLNETQDDNQPVRHSVDHAATEGVTPDAMIPIGSVPTATAPEEKTPEPTAPEPTAPEHEAPAHEAATTDHVNSTPRIRPRRAA